MPPTRERTSSKTGVIGFTDVDLGVTELSKAAVDKVLPAKSAEVPVVVEAPNEAKTVGAVGSSVGSAEFLSNVLSHVVAAAISHPFLALAARMASDTDLVPSQVSAGSGSVSAARAETGIFYGSGALSLIRSGKSLLMDNWCRSLYAIVASEGLPSLYRGCRSGIGLSVLHSLAPASAVCLLGLAETVFLRAVLKNEGKNRIKITSFLKL